MVQDTASDIKITGTETVTGQISSGANINASGGVTTTNVNASGSASGNSGDFLNGLTVGGQVFAGSGQFTGNLSTGEPFLVLQPASPETSRPRATSPPVALVTLGTSSG